MTNTLCTKMFLVPRLLVICPLADGLPHDDRAGSPDIQAIPVARHQGALVTVGQYMHIHMHVVAHNEVRTAINQISNGKTEIRSVQCARARAHLTPKSGTSTTPSHASSTSVS